MRSYFGSLLFGGMLALVFSFGAKAQEIAEKEEKTTRPVVAVFKADWCPYCKKLDPIMMGLMKEYEGKLDFIVFDITNKETVAKSRELAQKAGMEEFFEDNKEKSAFVVIFKENKELFRAKYKTEKKTYQDEFEKALK